MSLADRLGMSVRRCKQETPPRQFLKWRQYLREKNADEIERTEKWEHYAAQLFSIILGALGQKVPADKLLLRFKSVGHSQPAVEAQPADPATREQRLAAKKAFWDVFFAVNQGVRASVKEADHVHVRPRQPARPSAHR